MRANIEHLLADAWPIRKKVVVKRKHREKKERG